MGERSSDQMIKVLRIEEEGEYTSK